MQESESLFDCMLDQIVPPMPRAPVKPHGGVSERAIGARPTPREVVTGAELSTDHPPAVREVLRRAGLSMESELDADQQRRAREAVSMFPDPRTREQTIREFIRPRVEVPEDD